jgi:hypothetical protein
MANNKLKQIQTQINVIVWGAKDRERKKERKREEGRDDQERND